MALFNIIHYIYKENQQTQATFFIIKMHSTRHLFIQSVHMSVRTIQSEASNQNSVHSHIAFQQQSVTTTNCQSSYCYISK